MPYDRKKQVDIQYSKDGYNVFFLIFLYFTGFFTLIFKIMPLFFFYNLWKMGILNGILTRFWLSEYK
jgi:hypothetical protein